MLGLDVREDGQTARERVTNGWLTTGIIDAFLFAKKGMDYSSFRIQALACFHAWTLTNTLNSKMSKTPPLPWLIPVVSQSLLCGIRDAREKYLRVQFSPLLLEKIK